MRPERKDSGKRRSLTCETLVYTRSRVRVPLNRMPEEGAGFFTLYARESERVPEPASVEWDVLRRDI